MNRWNHVLARNQQAKKPGDSSAKAKLGYGDVLCTLVEFMWYGIWRALFCNGHISRWSCLRGGRTIRWSLSGSDWKDFFSALFNYCSPDVQAHLPTSCANPRMERRKSGGGYEKGGEASCRREATVKTETPRQWKWMPYCQHIGT